MARSITDVPGRSRLRRVLALAVVAVMLVGGAFPASAPAAEPAAKPAAAPYSLPWLLRPVMAGTVVRVDETIALFNNASGDQGTTAVTSLIATWKASPGLVPLFRTSWVSHEPPGAAASGTALANVLVGVSHPRPLGTWKSATFVAIALPTGQGGGDAPDAAAAAAVAAGIPARSAMDNALFAVNYWTVIGGLGLAKVTPDFTFQAEATVLRLTRSRGPGTQDGARTNFTAGVHAGHFLSPRVSLGAELRHQRWLTDAAPVRSNPDARENWTAGFGVRFHLPLAGKRWLRPGVAWTHALDAPLEESGYDMLQFDLPLAF